jgi:hypothetical protein
LPERGGLTPLPALFRGVYFQPLPSARDVNELVAEYLEKALCFEQLAAAEKFCA